MKSIRIRYCKVWQYYPRAARVAALIKDRTGLDSLVEEGARGEFTVWVDQHRVAQKTADGFPSDDDVLEAVQRALA